MIPLVARIVRVRLLRSSHNYILSYRVGFRVCSLCFLASVDVPRHLVKQDDQGQCRLCVLLCHLYELLLWCGKSSFDGVSVVLATVVVDLLSTLEPSHSRSFGHGVFMVPGVRTVLEPVIVEVAQAGLRDGRVLGLVRGGRRHGSGLMLQGRSCLSDRTLAKEAAMPCCEDPRGV